jgi:hypothetical protein
VKSQTSFIPVDVFTFVAGQHDQVMMICFDIRPLDINYTEDASVVLLKVLKGSASFQVKWSGTISGSKLNFTDLMVYMLQHHLKIVNDATT